MTSILDFAHTHWDASTIVTDVLVFGFYLAIAAVVILMVLFSHKLNLLDAEERTRKRREREWRESPEGKAQIAAEEAEARREALEMEAAAEQAERERHRAELEQDWPQYVVVLP